MLTDSAVSLPRLVILGSGFGAFSLINTLRNGLYDVAVVSPRNHFLFTPLLPSTTVGTLEFRSIIEPVRTGKTGRRFYQALCTAVDQDNQRIRCESTIDRSSFELSYDYLVIAVGTVSNTYGIRGVREYALFLRELSDARAIRQRVIERFEQASEPGRNGEKIRRLLSFIIVGGGPTGVEFAAELRDFLDRDIKKHYPALVRQANIVLLEANDHLLNTFDSALSEYTAQHFRRRGIEVQTNAAVEAIEPSAVVLNGGVSVPCGLVVWTAGTSPSPLTASLSLPKDRMGRMITDGNFLVKTTMNMFAVGDCAIIEGKDFPATGQVAQQEGAYLAKHLAALATGRPSKSFRYQHYGMLAYIGGDQALADLAAFKGKGFVTFLFWRSVYLTRLVSIKNKILVIFDWLKTMIFGRDISRF